MNTGSGSLRVKVYKLNDEGTWDDNGTGQATVEYYEVRLIDKQFNKLLGMISDTTEYTRLSIL